MKRPSFALLLLGTAALCGQRASLFAGLPRELRKTVAVTPRGSHFEESASSHYDGGLILCAESMTKETHSGGGGPLRFRYLLLDHDDTTVRGTEELHYPAHVESLVALRPDVEPVTLNGWFEKNHDPGISKYLTSLFDSEQMKVEHKIWETAVARKVPSFYTGMPELLAEFRERGGRVAVISHSPADAIARHYEAHPWADRIRPDLILGWDNDPEKRKPAVGPALKALEFLGASPAEALVLDDLSPGIRMAQAAGITTAAAGWGHDVPVVREFMQKECNYYFRTLEEFAKFLLSAPEHSAL